MPFGNKGDFIEPPWLLLQVTALHAKHSFAKQLAEGMHVCKASIGFARQLCIVLQEQIKRFAKLFLAE